METKRNSQTSQEPYFDSHSEYGEHYADFLVTLTEWGCGERTMVSTTLKNDSDIIDEYAEAEALKVLIECQMKRCDKEMAANFQAYVCKMKKLIGTVASVGDMVANDALVVAIDKMFCKLAFFSSLVGMIISHSG
mgnify:CR=1 FL=1